MKNLLKNLMLLLALTLPLGAAAYDFEVDSIYYLIQGNHVAVTKKDQNYNSYSGDVVIPPTVTHNGVTYTVTAIDDHAFYNSSGLTSVSMPNTITSLGIGAFYDCTGLTQVEIPNSVYSMGNGVFNGCTSLTSLVVPNSVVTIGNGMCYGCTKLTSVHFGSSVAQVGTTLFRNCSRLKSITVDSANTHFDSREDCNAFIETATDKLLFGCQASFVPNTVKVIGNSAFITQPIRSLVIPNSVTAIEDYAFCYSGLYDCVIGNSVTTLGDYAFYGSRNMKHLTLGNSVTTIGDWAFFECSSLTALHFPATVTHIGERSLERCGVLDTISVDSNNPCYDSRDNCNALIETATNTIIKGGNITVIPNTVTTIATCAFAGLSTARSVVIPANITTMNDAAYANCNYMKDVFCFIPDPDLVEVSGNAFSLIGYSYDSRTLHVPYDAVEAYQASSAWQPYFGSIVGMDPNAILSTSIHLNTNKIRIYIGKTVKLKATILPEDATDKGVIWTSNKENVVTVDENGLLTPHAQGTAVITATTHDGRGLSASCDVTVRYFSYTIDTCATIVDYLLGTSEEGYNLDFFDIDGDGVFDISDLAYLIDLLLQ